MADAFRTQIYTDLYNLLKSYKEYDSSGGTVESDAASDLANKIADSVANSVHNELMTKLYEVEAYQKTTEEKLRTLSMNLYTFMTAFSNWIVVAGDGGAALKAVCSGPASNTTNACNDLQGAIDLLNPKIEILKADLNDYKG